MLDLKKEDYFIVFVNGEALNCSQFMSIQDLLLYLNYNLKTIIIEHNKNIINISEFDKIILKNNDIIEVITIVGGG